VRRHLLRVLQRAVLSALVPASIAGSMKDEDFSGGFQHTQDCCGAAKEVERTVSRRRLADWFRERRKLRNSSVGDDRMRQPSWAFEPAHRTIATFDTAMILLQAVIEITGCRDAETSTPAPSSLAASGLAEARWSEISAR